MARLADIQAARLAGALLTSDAVKGDAVKGDAPFTLICRRKVRFWIGASATLAAIILISWKVESHDSQSSGLSLGALSPIQEKDMKFTQAMSVAVAAGSICSVVMAQSSAVQWTTASGGNGHWYARTIEVAIYPTLRSACEAKGGHLATLTTSGEWMWVKTQFPIPYLEGAFVGGYQDHSSPLYAEPNGGWRWVTGEPFVIDLSYMGSNNIVGAMTEPGFDDCPGGSVGLCGCGPSGAQDVLFYTGCCNQILDDVGDGVVQNCDSVARRGFIEYSADSNSDGIVDYGQILSGQLIDANSNGIPDICEIDPCPGDINLNSIVDAVDLAMALTSWGTSGGDYPRADVNHDGIVNGPDLGALLGGWGICP